jgi:pseudouridylate synthase
VTRIRLGEEVESARGEGSPVVALETSVIGQGLPSPANVECARRMDRAIREAGAVPAWIGVLDGDVVVGLSQAELGAFSEPGRSDKVARRDLPAAWARGGPGATTPPPTIWPAPRAGIRVGGTGGIGGVHLGNRDDVSADIWELARTPGLLVCSGPKSIVDPVATVERLEELGVTLIGYRTARLPLFVAGQAGIELEHRVETPEEAAAVLAASLALETRSTLLLCNPVPPELALDPQEVAAATSRAEGRATAAGVRGRDLTPFLLDAIAEETGGRSLDVNLALLEANAALAGAVAAATLRSTGDPGRT